MSEFMLLAHKLALLEAYDGSKGAENTLKLGLCAPDLSPTVTHWAVVPGVHPSLELAPGGGRTG